MNLLIITDLFITQSPKDMYQLLLKWMIVINNQFKGKIYILKNNKLIIHNTDTYIDIQPLSGKEIYKIVKKLEINHTLFFSPIPKIKINIPLPCSTSYYLLHYWNNLCNNDEKLLSFMNHIIVSNYEQEKLVKQSLPYSNIIISGGIVEQIDLTIPNLKINIQEEIILLDLSEAEDEPVSIYWDMLISNLPANYYYLIASSNSVKPEIEIYFDLYNISHQFIGIDLEKYFKLPILLYINPCILNTLGKNILKAQLYGIPVITSKDILTIYGRTLMNNISRNNINGYKYFQLTYEDLPKLIQQICQMDITYSKKQKLLGQSYVYCNYNIDKLEQLIRYIFPEQSSKINRNKYIIIQVGSNINKQYASQLEIDFIKIDKWIDLQNINSMIQKYELAFICSENLIITGNIFNLFDSFQLTEYNLYGYFENQQLDINSFFMKPWKIDKPYIENTYSYSTRFLAYSKFGEDYGIGDNFCLVDKKNKRHIHYLSKIPRNYSFINHFTHSWWKNCNLSQYEKYEIDNNSTTCLYMKTCKNLYPLDKISYCIQNSYDLIIGNEITIENLLNKYQHLFIIPSNTIILEYLSLNQILSKYNNYKYVKINNIEYYNGEGNGNIVVDKYSKIIDYQNIEPDTYIIEEISPLINEQLWLFYMEYSCFR